MGGPDKEIWEVLLKKYNRSVSHIVAMGLRYLY